MFFIKLEFIFLKWFLFFFFLTLIKQTVIKIAIDDSCCVIIIDIVCDIVDKAASVCGSLWVAEGFLLTLADLFVPRRKTGQMCGNNIVYIYTTLTLIIGYNMYPYEY